MDRRTGWTAALALAGVALLAAGLVAFSVPNGPGLSPDSLSYLLLARALRRGQGFVLFGDPLAHFPPGYPALLALCGATGPETLPRARALHAALAGLEVVLVSLAGLRLGGPRAAALAALLVVGSPAWLSVHVMAWSEPLLMVLALSALLLMGAGRALPGAALLAAALLTRYAALALVPVLFLAALLTWREDRAPRRALVLAAAPLAPLGLWLLRNAALSGSLTNRALSFHPPGLGFLQQAAAAAGEAWGLSAHPAWAAAALLPALAVARELWRPAARLGRLLALWAASYAAFLLASLSLGDADTPLDQRVTSPFLVLGAIVLAGQVARLPAGRARAAATALLALLGLAHAAQAVAFARETRGLSGIGYDARFWRESATLLHLRAHPPSFVHSNAPEAVEFYADVPARDLPTWSSRLTLERRPEFEGELAALCALLARGGTTVAWLDGVDWRWQLVTAEELEERCGAAPSLRLEDGRLYGLR